jgi:hypothetical protein
MSNSTRPLPSEALDHDERSVRNGVETASLDAAAVARSDDAEPVRKRRLMTSSPEALRELGDGELVVIAARWILVASGILLAVWNPAPIGELRIQIVLLLGIAVANFFLHANVLRRKETLLSVAYASSAVDLLVISILVGVDDGFTSGLYVFYFPAIAALSLALPREISATLVLCGIALYAIIGFSTLPEGAAGESAQAMIVRLVMMAGVAVCGALYQQVEANRRQAADVTAEIYAPEISVPEAISVA